MLSSWESADDPGDADTLPVKLCPPPSEFWSPLRDLVFCRFRRALRVCLMGSLFCPFVVVSFCLTSFVFSFVCEVLLSISGWCFLFSVAVELRLLSCTCFRVFVGVGVNVNVESLSSSVRFVNGNISGPRVERVDPRWYLCLFRCSSFRLS